MELPSLRLIAIGVITVVVVKLFKLGYDQVNYWKKRGVPYIEGVPFLGTGWKILFRRIKFHDYCSYVYNAHPNARYVGTMDLATPAVVIRDPELIKEIGVKNFEHFMNHRLFTDETIDPIFTNNIFALKGDRWKEMRSTLSPSFTASKMKFLFELVAKCSRDFVDYLYDHPELCSSIEMKDTFTRYTNDVIATAAFGITVNSMKDRKNEFFEKGAAIASFGSVWNIVKFIILRISPTVSRTLGFSLFPKSVTSFFNHIVSETIKMREEKGIVRPDMIHLLMEARDKEKVAMSIDDIVAQAFIFFLAGFDTSSTLMVYMAYELAINPDIQDRLYKEVDHHMKEGNGDITYDALAKMEYMEMVMSETLRKYPPVIFLDRVCNQKFELPPSADSYKSYTVHEDSIVWVPVYALHRDPQYFPNPEKFDPERFNEANKDSFNPYAYVPFGFGPRKCIGNRFANMETKIMFAHLLHKFNLKPCEKTKIPLEIDSTGFSLKAEGGTWLALEKRNV